MAVGSGDADRAERLFRGAAALMRELATPFPMAVVLLEHAEWLAAAGAAADPAPLLAEARAVFGGLRAAPWLARADAIGAEAGDRIAG
jgi:hypothetical protein